MTFFTEKNIDNTKTLVVIFVVLFLISSFFLSYSDKNNSDLNKQNDWWLIYFNEPKNDSLTFTIENHSKNESFHWEILLDKTRLQQEDAIVPKGKSVKIPINTEDLADKKVRLIVSDNENNKKNIYKIISSK